jgi:hypothetical protein
LLGRGLRAGGLEHSEQLDHAADEKSLLVDLDPDSGGSRKHHMVARLHGHLDSGLLPPVKTGPNRQHDPVLGRRIVRSRRHDEAGSPHPILIELLDDDLVEERPELVPTRLDGPAS